MGNSVAEPTTEEIQASGQLSETVSDFDDSSVTEIKTLENDSEELSSTRVVTARYKVYAGLILLI